MAAEHDIIDLGKRSDLDDDVERVYLIRVDDIDDSERLRPVDPVRAEGIALSMRKDGQLQPIDVCRLPNLKSGKPFKLVFGGHRVAAVRINGWDYVKGVIRSNNALERRAREIAENFWRAELSPLDRAKFISELMETEKARLGIAADKDGRAGNKRQKKQVDDDLRNLRTSMGLQETVASQLGLNRQEVSRQLALMDIKPSVAELVRETAIGGNASQLRALAKVHWSEQMDVVKLIREGKAKGVSDAIAAQKGKPVDTPEKKRLNTFLDTFGRMGAAEKAEALRLLSAQMPAGWKLSEVKPREKMPTNAELRAMVDAQAEADDDTIDIEEAIASQGGAA